MSLFFVIVSCFGVFAADESGNVLSSFFEVSSVDFYYLNFSSGASAVPNVNVYSEPNEFNFNRVGYAPYFEFSGINRIYSTFYSLPSFDVSEYKYFSFEFNLAVMSSNVLIDGSSLNFIDIDGNYYNLGSLLDEEYGISLNYNGVDITGVNSYFFGEVSDLSFYSSTGKIQGYVDVRVTGTQNFNVFSSPLIIKLYKNYQDLIADVNNNVQQIVNQNDVIINNLTEVKGQLNNIHNSLNSNNDPANPELDLNVSIAEDVEKEFADRFNDFIDPSFQDAIFNKFTDIFADPKFSSAMIFVRDIFDSLFFRVPVLGILFAVGGGAVLVAALFGIASRALSDRHESHPPDTRDDIYKPQHFSSDRYNYRR